MKYNLNHIVFSRILNNFPSQAILFFLHFFYKSDKLHSQTIRLGPYIFYNNLIIFYNKHIWFKWFIFLLWNIPDKCQPRTIQYRLTQSLHFNQFLSKTNMVRFALYLQVSVNFYHDTILNTIVNKVPWKALFFLPDRLLINFYHGTIWFDPYCPFI